MRQPYRDLQRPSTVASYVAFLQHMTSSVAEDFAGLRSGGGGPTRRAATVKHVRISVALFAVLRERAGAREIELDLPDSARASDALAALVRCFHR